MRDEAERCNPYEVLALSKWATEAEIEDAYARRGDRVGADKKRRTELDRARDELKDPERRARWDLETYVVPLSDRLRSYVLTDLDPWRDEADYES